MSTPDRRHEPSRTNIITTTTAAIFPRSSRLISAQHAFGLGEAEIHRRISAHRRGRRENSRPAAGGSSFSRSRRGGFHCGHRRRVHCAGDARQTARARAAPVVEGVGWINCAHGRFPIPAPATLAILGARGIGVTQCDEPHELVTPTGAALLAEFAESFGPMRDWWRRRSVSASARGITKHAPMCCGRF